MVDQHTEPSPDQISVTVPPPPPPVMYSPGAGYAQASTRPTAVTVIGILMIVFASLAIISLPFPFFVSRMVPTSRSGMTTFNLVLSALHSILWLVLGIALLRLVAWARKLTIIGLIASFIVGIISSIISAQTNPAFQQMQATPGDDSGRIIVWIVLGISLVLTAVTNGLFIYFLTRPNVVAAFRNVGEK